MKQTQTVQSVERALTLMECFTLANPTRSLGELSKLTGLSKSTVYRLLSTLAALDYIKQDPNSQKYSLGFKLFNLGAVVIGNMNLRTVALPYLEELSRETSETISLNIADGNDRVCIELVESPEEVRNFTRIGHRNRLWIGGSGKVLLAFSDQDTQQEVIEFAKEDGVSIEEISVLEEKLQVIADQGFAITTNERVNGSFAIVAPIFEFGKKLVGTITLSGPIQRFTKERMVFLKEKVCETAWNISKELGHT